MGKLFALAWGEHQQTSLRIRGHSRAKFSTVFQITCSAVTSQLCTETHTRAEGSPWGCAPGKGARLLFISVFYRANMKWFLQETDTTLWIWKCNLALAGTNILNGTGKCQLAGTWSLWGKLRSFTNSPLAERVRALPWLAHCKKTWGFHRSFVR